jgi:tripartite-type tricarboxylate transporter receptor subunit TctC
MPDVAPLSATYPGLVISNWHALFAPIGTPAAIIQLLHDEFKKVYADPELQQRLAILSIDPAWLSGSELSRRIETDTVKWTNFIKAANIKAE